MRGSDGCLVARRRLFGSRLGVRSGRSRHRAPQQANRLAADVEAGCDRGAGAGWYAAAQRRSRRPAGGPSTPGRGEARGRDTLAVLRGRALGRQPSARIARPAPARHRRRSGRHSGAQQRNRAAGAPIPEPVLPLAGDPSPARVGARPYAVAVFLAARTDRRDMTAVDTPPRWDLTPIFAGLDDRAFNRRARRRVRRRRPARRALRRARHPRRPRRARSTDADVAALESVLDATNELQAELRPSSPTSTRSCPPTAATTPRPRVTSSSRPGPRRSRRSASGSARGSRRSASTTLDRAQPGRGRARVRAAQGGGGRRAPDERAGGVARGRARAVGIAGVAAAARRRLVAADGRRPRGRRERRARADGVRARARDAPGRRAGAARRTKASSRRGRRVAVPLAAALNGAKGELGVLNRRRGFADDLEPALRANNVDRATLDAMNRRGRGVAARLPALPPRQGAAARPRRRSAVVGPASRPVGRAGHVAWASATDHVRDAFAGYSPDLAGARRPRVRRAVGRRRDARRQAGRRVLRGRERRRQPHHDELRRQPGFGVDPRARARPRVPQRRARAAHAAPAAAADGARRDRVDLLRDAALRAPAAAGRRRRRAARAARRAPRRRDPDRRRHPQPVPLRDRALRAPPAHDALGRRPEAPRCSTRRKPRTATACDPITATSTCGR